MRLGLLPYSEALALQHLVAAARRDGSVPDVLMLLEHPPVYTRGRRTTDSELPMGAAWYEAQGIEVLDTDRGGRVTYHGPGQLVGYPVVALHPYRNDVVAHVRRLEQVISGVLAGHGIEAGCLEGETGVWTAGNRKIGSIGVHVGHGVTTHGFAVNVNNDLQPFDWIVPCGIEGCRTSSVTRETGAAQDMNVFMDAVRDRYGEVFGRRPRDVGAAELLGAAGGSLSRPVEVSA